MKENNSNPQVNKIEESLDKLASNNQEEETIDKENITLLEERLAVQRTRRKVGEVVVRKVIETHLVEVPVRREKLIVEQIGSETKQLAEIDLGRGEITGVELNKIPHTEAGYSVKGEFYSPQAAKDILEAIALQENHGCLKVRVEIMVENPQIQETYQKMLDLRLQE